MLFTHPDVVPKLYDFLFSMEHKRRYFQKCLTMEVSGQENCLVLQKNKVTLFGMTQKRMNDDRNFIELNYY